VYFYLYSEQVILGSDKVVPGQESVTHDVVNDAYRLHDTYPVPLGDLCSDLVPKVTARYGSRAYLTPLASNTLLVPSRLAFLQRSTSGTACLRLS